METINDKFIYWNAILQLEYFYKDVRNFSFENHSKNFDLNSTHESDASG